MKRLDILFRVLFFTFLCKIASAQTTDSTQNLTNFSGSVGITTNGFSIIPSFSLNSPAFISRLSWRKKRFSFEPDIRIVPDATKGGLLFWLRYRLIEKKKFSLRLGVHPAFNLVRKTVIDNGQSRTITEWLSFAAFEVVPNYQFSKNFGASIMYLEGHGLQSFGPKFTNVLFLNTSITNIGLSENVKLHLFPSVSFLYTDGYRGDYLTLTTTLAHNKIPFSLQSTINQTIKSDVPNNLNFMWNVGVNYNFNRDLKKVN